MVTPIVDTDIVSCVVCMPDHGGASTNEALIHCVDYTLHGGSCDLGNICEGLGRVTCESIEECSATTKILLVRLSSWVSWSVVGA